MIKRLLSVMLAASLVLSLFCVVPASATQTVPDNLRIDYVPGEVTGNLFVKTNPSSGIAQANDYSQINSGWDVRLEGETASMVSVATTNYEGHTGIAGSVMYTAKRTVPNPWITYDKTGEYAVVAEGQNQYMYPLNGTIQMSGSIAYPDDMPTDGNMVFSVKVNNKSNTEGAKIVAARTKTNTGETSPSHFQYPMEYPNTTDGMVITATGNDTQLFACTFADTEIQTTKQFVYSLGLPEGTAAGTVIRAVSDLYLGLEYAYDIKVTADKKSVRIGETLNVDADVLNQGLLPGGIEQSVTWYAMNAGRTAFVDGFAFIEGKNGTATVSVNGIAPGKYNLVAVADADDVLVKGIEIEVIGFEDYVPGEIKGNVLTNPVEISKNYNHNVKLSGESSKFYDVEVSKETFSSNIKLSALRELSDPHIKYADADGDGIYTWDGSSMIYDYAYSGGIVSRNFGDDANKKENVVFSFKLKNSGSTSAVNVNFGRTNNGHSNTSASKAEYPAEYNTKDKGIEVSSKYSWTTFEGMFENTGKNTVQNYTYVIGLTEGNKKNAAVTVSSDAYMGIEYGYDIALTKDETVWKHGVTETINLDADVFNQIGKTGGLSQNVTWYALNADRTKMVSGFKFIKKADGKAELVVSDAVPAGTYTVVAIADVNNELIKGTQITVEGRTRANQYIMMDFENEDISSAIFSDGASASVVSDGCGDSQKAMLITTENADAKVSFPLRTIADNTYKISVWVKPTATPESQDVYFDIVNSSENGDVKNTITATKSTDFSESEWTYVTAEYKPTRTDILPDGEISLRIGNGLAGTYVIDDFFVIPYVKNKIDSRELIKGGNFDTKSDLLHWKMYIQDKNLTDEQEEAYYLADGYEGGAIRVTTVNAFDSLNVANPIDIQLCKKYEVSYYAKAINADAEGKAIWNYLSMGGENYTGEIAKFVHITNTNNPTLTTEWQKFTFLIDLDYITAYIPEISMGFRVGDNAELTSGLRPDYAVDSISVKQIGDVDFSVNSMLYGSVSSNAVLQFNFLDSTKGNFVYRVVKETADGDFVIQTDTTKESMVELGNAGNLTDSRFRLDLIGIDGYGNYSQVYTEYLSTEGFELTDTINLRPNNYLWNDSIDTLSSTLTYKSETDLKRLNVFGALYSADGKLLSIQSAPLTVNKNEENTATATLPLKNENGKRFAADKAKFFAWFDDSQMPATATCEIDKAYGEFIYVDANSTASSENGTSIAPFKTVESARSSWRNELHSTDKDTVYVVLKSGEYFQEDAISLTAADCVEGKKLIFTTLSGEKAKISGGKHITGFTPYKNGIYRASVPAGTNSRQLYINGVKATRARSVEDVKGFTNLDAGATKTTFANKGLICADASYADYKYPNELELAFIENWRHHYITVDEITKTNDGSLFSFTQSGNLEAWKKIVTLQTPATIPVYLENALELLDEPGEWYLDTHENYLYYMPRSFENIQTADVVIPVTQELITLTGTADAPVKNIQFKNIDFVYSAWNYPTENRNYMCSQGAFYGTQTTVPADTGSQIPDGAVELTNAHFITIDNCDFAHLGSMALRMTGAIQNCDVIGNEFYEISGAAMALGELEGDSRNPQEEKYYITDNLIANNYIHKVADDYYSAAAISVGFPKNTTIRNNELVDGAYSGFHIGWGWTLTSDAATENLVIESNYIHNFMNWRLFDGAPIYSVGKTGGTKENPNIIRGNYLQDTLKSVAGIYPDQGSTFWEISENVIDNHRYSYIFSDKETTMSSPIWLNIWEFRMSDIYVSDNYSTTANYRNEGTRVEFEQAEIYPDANWPSDAQNIINKAGIEEEYIGRFDFDVQILTTPTKIDVTAGKTIPFAYNALSTKDKFCDLSDYEITVKSSDESVATATADSITGVSAGKAWITYMLCKKNAEGEVVYYDEHTFCVIVK